MRPDPNTLRCPVCATPWSEHPDTCSRHPYRPTIRRDSEGRDVSDMPGLWDCDDTFHYPELPKFGPVDRAEEERIEAIARLRARRSSWRFRLFAERWEKDTLDHALAVLESTS